LWELDAQPTNAVVVQSDRIQVSIICS